VISIDKDGLLEFCKDLVRIPSQSGKEKQAAQRATEEYRRLGFDECECDKYGSAVAVLSNGPGPTIVFDAHLDTVGVDPIREWTHDPFGAWVEDDKLFGRGAADMKGGAAAITYGAAALLAQRERFSGTVVVSLSTMEELCEGVALGNVIEERGADFVVIGEASELRLVRGQRGRVEIALKTVGVPAHSSTPQLGVDAVQKMIKLIGLMSEMELPSHPFLGRGVQALTDIISTPYPAQSMVPSRCRATFDRRLVVGEDETSIAAELHEMIEGARQGDPQLQAMAEIVSAECQAYTGHRFEFKKFIPAWEMQADHELVRGAAAALEGEGLGGEPTYYRFCTNGSWACVHCDVPTIGFGPGSAELAHRVDEYIETGQLEAAARGYAAIALQALAK